MTERNRPLRVVYFGTYRASYSRNASMIEGLRRSGVEVEECHETLWRGIEDRVQAASGSWKRPSFLWRVARAYARLIARYLRLRPFDVLVVGYPGQADVFLARLLAWWSRRPLVWDVFMSIYLIAVERGLDNKSPATMRLLHSLERRALRLPQMLVHDTEPYMAWLCSTYGLSSDRFRLVPTGADDRKFSPRPAVRGNIFEVLYYGTFIPNHGVLVVIGAACALAGESGIRFTFIGTGPDRAAAERCAVGLENVTFVDWMEKEALAGRIATADVCLGAFGPTPQSLMTVQNKIYECLAMGKAVITGDSPAVRQAFVHGEHLYWCERTPEALAAAIIALRDQPELRERMGRLGLALFREHYSLDRIGELFARHLQEACEDWALRTKNTPWRNSR
jgi:glycosyltransferase involved in cell wall biosynthesis